MERRVAVVSDVMMGYGGAERVVEELLNIFPSADLYTLFIVPSAREKLKEKYPKTVVHTSIFQAFINKDEVSKYVSIIKFFSWIYWEIVDLKRYYLIISSSHSFMSKNVKKGKNAFHLAYIHTPPRYLYKEFCEIGIIRSFPLNVILWPIMEFLRWIDRRGSKKPNVLVANSKNVQSRIRKYYELESVVIYPPVEVFSQERLKGNYFVCLSRLVKQKGIDLAVKVCSKNNIPLVVIGDGDEMVNLRKISGSTIKFVGNCEDIEKFKILAEAKALIYTSREEDFGMVPVEALKVGTPVIAYNSGGVGETVVDGKNGVMFDDFSEISLDRAIERFNRLKISVSMCKKSVKKFSTNIFRKKIMNLIPE